MDPKEQLRLPMSTVGSMRAFEFDVLVVDAGRQLPVSNALFFDAGYWLPAACRSLFLFVHQEGIASSASIRPHVASPVSSLAKEITTRVRKISCACKFESRICSLSYATKVRTRINNDNDDYIKKNFSEEASKGCFAFFLSIP